MSITRKDLNVVFEHVVRLATESGVVRPGMKLVLMEGSKTYGRAYRLYEQPINPEDGTGMHGTLLLGPGSYLGMTKSEAYLTLSTIRDVLYAVTNREFLS